MLNWKTGVTAALLAAGLAFGAQAQEYKQVDLVKPIDKKLTFIFIPKLIHPWYEELENGVKFAVEEYKKAGIDIAYVWDAPPQADVDEHNRRIETDIGRAPDGLAVSCLDPATNISLIDEAIANKLNVITFDTACDPKYPFVGHRLDEQDGRDLANFLADKLGGKGKVGILSGSLTAPNHVARVVGFKDEMAKKHPDIQIVFEQPDNDSLETAVTLTENALQANPDLAGMFGANASAPIGAGRAVQAANMTGKTLVVGMDALPETVQLIKDGVVVGVKSQRQWEIGYWAVKYLVAMNQNHTIPMDHPTGSVVMTKETFSN
ncbi:MULTISPECIES: substrate-binding domain-containing protein [unclassified Mesorhizobium]|jgi:ribose transport system substrate-binding protein|uniref:substrate-binding domain-containing protein n=1 Tax=unclassified Mesorhizobium TaxID=325217 RepID=UPI0008F3166A|nr:MULTISPECIES: substrate-binding domain-containing protein [unclassified Mesorhizobium]RJG41584.1 sugar ABC transporter substrate-binding protein [Mesorhizobium sp. DCY119]SFU10638.1 monosaccharide ABC transporter substrate-binding protein, CUT2 family [Mesorhizobium sp. YR577]